MEQFKPSPEAESADSAGMEVSRSRHDSPRLMALAVDRVGNIYIADAANHIRKVRTDGAIETIAVSDNYGTSGDGGPASEALLI